MNPSSNYIGQRTRQFLAWQGGLSGGDIDAIERALSEIRATSPSGQIYDLALGAGANEHYARLAAVCAELFYASTSLTDDIQDGDAIYAGGDLAHQINVQAMLICASFMALTELSLTYSFGRGGLEMLKGQAAELSIGEVVEVDAYERIANAIGGAAFREYLKLVAVAVLRSNGEEDRDMVRLWGKYGHALGVLIQVVTDQESEDPRWFKVDPGDRFEYAMKAVSDFRDIANRMPELKVLMKLTESNMRRAKWAFFGKEGGSDM